MKVEQVVALLRRECNRAGGQAPWAAAAKVSTGYVNDVLQGRREPGEKMLHALGLERVVTFRRMTPRARRA